MNDLDIIKELHERRSQLQAKYSSLKSDMLKVMSSDSDSNEYRSIMAEFGSLSQELQAVNEQIFNIEHADEIKSQQELQAQEEERKAREIAEREKRLQEAKLAEEKRKADLLAQERAKAEPEQKAKEAAKAKIVTQESKLIGKKSSAEQLNVSADKIIDILKVQITPSTMCVEPNDVFIKTVFNACKSAYSQLLGGKYYAVKEKRKTHKKDAVFSKLEIQNVEGYDNDSPLDEFDRAVLGVIISEYLIDNLYTTVNIIHRALIGRPGQGIKGFYPKKDQKKSIVDSVIKLMSTVVDFSGVNDSLKAMKYTDKDGNEITFRASNLLVADIIDAKINGQVMEGVIFFKANSPLFQIADAKDQVIRYHHAILNVPNQNNTPLVISLKK
ncbi:MAG: hypothetical protein IJQ82_07545, partial [Selenomonadaceae bacterium]|nr:hypothetical protein [Selenomonadaceae bacterium]